MIDLDVDLDMWDRVFAVNVKGTFLARCSCTCASSGKRS
jgi:hypothetical protein